MLINLVKIIYFSPTGTTKKVLENIVNGIAPKKSEFSDLRANGNKNNSTQDQADLVIIGVPTYISRVPPEALKELKKLSGNKTPIVLVTVYGNNKFGDTLLEMKNISKSNGFTPIAAGAFIGEHSFSSCEKPIAHARPDSQDINEAKTFGKAIRKKLHNYNSNSSNNDLKVPGNFPYREWHKLPAQAPSTDTNLCTNCGRCVSACPVNAIKIDETFFTDSNLCIFCCACVKECPVNARKITDPKLLEIKERLHLTCSERKVPEIFI